MINPTILYEDNDLICVIKPAGIPTQPDKTGDKDVMTFLNGYLENKKEENSHIGLIHRLDRPVGGVLLFSKNKYINSKLSQMMQQNKIKKEYLAIVCGKANQEGTLENYLQKNGRTNLSFVVDKQTINSKKAVLSYNRMQTIKENQDYYSLLNINLKTGRHHQIRVQLAYAGIPILGDQKYNTLQQWKKGTSIALWCYRLTFKHPKTNQNTILQCIPKQEPYSKFTIFE
ncbi:RluA family pseudouridine synthase [Lachnospiraceae bacterium 46-61]